MERSSRALIVAEDALAEIVRVEKSLRALIKSSCDSAGADALAAAQTALTAANEAKSDIVALTAAIAELKSTSKSICLTCLSGTARGANVSFGRIKVTGPTVAMVRYDGNMSNVRFNGTLIGSLSMASPAYGLLKEDSGYLTIAGAHANSRAVLVGEFELLES